MVFSANRRNQPQHSGRLDKKELEKRGLRFVRYADDFIVLLKSRQAGERVMQSLQRFLERNLQLKINQEKSRVASTNQTVFLGLTLIGISEYYRPISEIDQWLRRHLRMCYFKQWRRARTIVRELRKLGTSLHTAISVANKSAKARGDYPGRWQRKLA